VSAKIIGIMKKDCVGDFREFAINYISIGLVVAIAGGLLLGWAIALFGIVMAVVATIAMIVFK